MVRWSVLYRLPVCVASVLMVLCGCQTPAFNVTPMGSDTVTAAQPVPPTQSLFELEQVSLNSGPFQHAQQVNIQYLLSLNADRLLAPYLREAGLAPKAENYGNWENSGLNGHIGGHYLTALSLGWAATGDAAVGQRLDYMLSELRRAQQATGGYLGGIPNSQTLWREIARGEINADLFSLNERWVPLYNIDKIFHGLRDAYVIGHRQSAKAMLQQLGEWMLTVTADLSEQQFQSMLYSEHGALNAVFADMAKIFDDARYLVLARSLTHQQIIAPLTQQQDQLTGLHANTQIPKIIGALKVAQADNNQTWQRAARFFWETVSQQRSVSIGGNSVREHFHDKSDFTPMIEDVEGPETCNTYNMLKLSKLLFLKTGDTRYIEFYERATYNHILSSQHPQHGGLVYFTPMRPGHYRMYSSVQQSMWCCVGSGIENHSKYGELVFTQDVDNLWVNLFISSSLRWREKGISLDLSTSFPDRESVSLTISSDSSRGQTPWTLNIRRPTWLTGNMRIRVNGMVVDVQPNDGYMSITRHWGDGDEVTFTLPSSPYVEQLPDQQDYYSVLYGPVVLATKVTAFENEQLRFVADDSRMGHIASGPVCPPEALPVMLGEPTRFLDGLIRLPGKDLAFKATSNVATGRAGDNPLNETPETMLIPFYRLHDARYQVYWPQMKGSEFSDFVAGAKARSAKQAALSAQTIDSVSPGEQQPEVEHAFAGDNTAAGVNAGRHWRDARGWFSYQLSNPEGRAHTLRLTYFSGDLGRTFDVIVNDVTLATVTLPEGQPASEFYSVDYVLPPRLRDDKTLTLKFAADSGSVAGGIYGVRLLAKPQE